MKTVCVFLSSFILLNAIHVAATPAQVVMIRHAEKPPHGRQVTSEGCERAYALSSFFQLNPKINANGPPVAIYAQRPDTKDGSIRAVQTLAPFAADTHMTVEAKYVRDDYEDLVQEVLSQPSYDGKTVLIAWEHSVIPMLAQAFGVDASQMPSTWPGRVFDQAWVLDWSGHKAVSLEIVPEYVLPTDNPQGGANWGDGPQSPTSSSPQLPAEIVHKCANNDSLNELVKQVTSPTLPTFVFSDDPEDLQNQ